jgi:hypothetical protein
MALAVQWAFDLLEGRFFLAHARDEPVPRS